MPVIPDQARAEYQQLINAHIETLTKKMAEQRVDYSMVNTSTPLDFALFHYLSRREALARAR
jgi:hypothetical protein